MKGGHYSVIIGEFGKTDEHWQVPLEGGGTLTLDKDGKLTAEYEGEKKFKVAPHTDVEASGKFSYGIQNIKDKIREEFEAVGNLKLKVFGKEAASSETTVKADQEIEAHDGTLRTTVNLDVSEKLAFFQKLKERFGLHHSVTDELKLDPSAHGEGAFNLSAETKTTYSTGQTDHYSGSAAVLSSIKDMIRPYLMNLEKANKIPEQQ